KVVNNVIAIKRRTLPRASEKLRLNDSNTPLPSTSITCGTYATRPTMKKNNHMPIATANSTAMIATTAVTHGAISVDTNINAITISMTMYETTVTTLAEIQIQIKTINDAPSRPQKRARTAA